MKGKIVCFILVINLLGFFDIFKYGDSNENFHVFITSFFCFVIVHSIVIFILFFINKLTQ